jgi:uncharacterized protein (DUF488 family)
LNPLFTIGHSTHEISKFLGLLKQHRIEVVADVRSRPHSRFEWFSRPALEKALKENGIRYVFLGEELGARREERECYIGLRADYDLISLTTAFQSGMKRLRTGVERFRVALMCSEREPLDCHRTVLVCRHAKPFADISHIHADGRLESHADAELRMMSRYIPEEGDLFRSPEELLNLAYKRRGVEINYVEKTEPTSSLKEDPANYES